MPAHPPLPTCDSAWTPTSATDATAPLARPARAPRLDLTLIARRYQLIARIGQGSFGEVWEARDALGGGAVAVKLLDIRGGETLRQIRQEVTALRWLRLPGVAQLLDDGVEGGRYFVVMDLVPGTPFPGSEGLDWAALRPIVAAVAERLERVHLAGVVHRDLKPGNLLVNRDGQPTLLDFGLAVGHALAPEQVEGRFAGTPRYAAPEQCRGEPAEASADIYALGIMLFEALTGTWPHQGSNPREVIRRRGFEPAPALASLTTSLPAEVTALIDGMLSVSPADRPTAEAVRKALGVQPEAPRAVGLRRFAGPDLFLHRDTDAAKLLRWRAGPTPAAQSAELESWRRAGLARPDASGRLVVEPPALASLAAGLRLPGARDAREGLLTVDDLELLNFIRLSWPDGTVPLLAGLLDQRVDAVEARISRLSGLRLIWPLPDGRLGASCRGDPVPGWSPKMRREAHRHIAERLPSEHGARVRHLAAAGSPPGLVLTQVRRALQSGANLSERLALEDLGLQLARAEDDPAAEADLLRSVALTALDEESLPGLERALYELGRTTSEPDRILETLLHAARAGLRGEAERALEHLDDLGPLDNEDLERWRVALLIRATSLLGTEAEARLVASLEEWARAGSSLRRAQWLGWSASLGYREGDYAEAARLQAESVALRPPGLGRLSARCGLAAALLEVPRLDETRAVARDAAREARRLRHARYESLSRWIARNAQLRAGTALRPQPAFVAAAAPLGPQDQGLWAITEAAIAWQTGRLAQCAELARAATGCFERSRNTTAGVLSRALTAAAEPGTPRASLDALAEEAALLATADFAVQALGLLRRATSSPDPRWRDLALARASARPASEWDLRLDVLSYRESVA